MKKIFFACLALLCAVLAQGQEKDTATTLEPVIIIIGRDKELSLKQAKPLATIDEYLQQSQTVSMIRRGSYAWEPAINSMSSERTLITLEGMHIFGACTDKMDPITSYVEVSNLSQAAVTSGQHGGGFGATIGGAINLMRNRTGFKENGWKFQANTGFETNAGQKIIGSAVNFSSARFFSDFDFMHRSAGNYKAGGGREIANSQFSKYNVSGTIGFLADKNKIVEASLIYDKATDIGYPALPMDVSLAEALITSIRYEVRPASGLVKSWESKIYFNTVSHDMDDTGRENVAIHMDMPGRTKTLGGYLLAGGTIQKHRFQFNFNAYYNASLAEMTMFPEDPSENAMFMFTWPDVRTGFSGVFIEDTFEINCHSSVKATASAGFHSNFVASDPGMESLQIFYSGANRTNQRLLKSIAATYRLKKKWEVSFGLAYGERAPSVSEGYGFYLFNSFDNYDYIGNPVMANEKSLEANATLGIKTQKTNFGVTASFFRISDFIIGKTAAQLMPMTIGASGVKIYQSIAHAQIANFSTSLELEVLTGLRWKSQLNFSHAADNDGKPLPFISPLGGHTAIEFQKRAFSLGVSAQANASQTRFAADYGEDKTPAFAILGITAGYRFGLGDIKLYSKAGVENLLDANYSTYSDWNNIPRKGRNVFINLVMMN